MLDEGEPPEFPAELEGGEDGVLAGEGDERGTGQRPVRVDAGPGVPQAVLAPGHQALLTAAPERECGKMRDMNVMGYIVQACPLSVTPVTYSDISATVTVFGPYKDLLILKIPVTVTFRLQ